ncbi:hypothetical protein Ga0100231_000965 [Opitutaceae bacterium TAV4]|nr:hypothetical protein Ga0100231_000965 [Opitutaceae bacterium TAV4]
MMANISFADALKNRIECNVLIFALIWVRLSASGRVSCKTALALTGPGFSLGGFPNFPPIFF